MLVHGVAHWFSSSPSLSLPLITLSPFPSLLPMPQPDLVICSCLDDYNRLLIHFLTFKPLLDHIYCPHYNQHGIPECKSVLTHNLKLFNSFLLISGERSKSLIELPNSTASSLTLLCYYTALSNSIITFSVPFNLISSRVLQIDHVQSVSGTCCLHLLECSSAVSYPLLVPSLLISASKSLPREGFSALPHLLISSYYVHRVSHYFIILL